MTSTSRGRRLHDSVKRVHSGLEARPELVLGPVFKTGGTRLTPRSASSILVRFRHRLQSNHWPARAMPTTTAQGGTFHRSSSPKATSAAATSFGPRTPSVMTGL